jgi:hypothetical protein
MQVAPPPLDSIQRVLNIIVAANAILAAVVAVLAWVVRVSVPSRKEHAELHQRVAALEQIAENLPSQRDLADHRVQMERTTGAVSTLQATLDGYRDVQRRTEQQVTMIHEHLLNGAGR